VTRKKSFSEFIPWYDAQKKSFSKVGEIRAARGCAAVLRFMSVTKNCFPRVTTTEGRSHFSCVLQTPFLEEKKELISKNKQGEKWALFVGGLMRNVNFMCFLEVRKRRLP
jgi:hypothetical protein